MSHVRRKVAGEQKAAGVLHNVKEAASEQKAAAELKAAGML